MNEKRMTPTPMRGEGSTCQQTIEVAVNSATKVVNPCDNSNDVDQEFAQLKEEMYPESDLQPITPPTAEPQAPQEPERPAVVSGATTEEKAQQGELIDLEPVTPPLPIDYLPQVIQDYINDVAEVYTCPRDYAAAAVMSAVASAAGNNFVSTDNHHNRPCLWLVLVGRSGVGKTDPLRLAFDPLTAINRGLIKQCRDEHKRKLAECKANKNDSEAPTRKRTQLVLKDVTPEARNVILSDSPRGAVTVCDELSGLFDAIGRYTAKSDEVQRMISLFNGETFTVNRLKYVDVLEVNDPFLNIIGGIQPSQLLRTIGNPKYIGMGLSQRFLYVYPDTKLSDLSERTPNTELAKVWEQGINAIYAKGETRMYFTPGAKEVYRAYFNECRVKAESYDENSPEGSFLCSCYNKLQIHVIRWAMAAQIARATWGGESYDITAEAMDYAVRCMHYFEATYNKVWEVIGAPQASRKVTRAECFQALFSYYPKQLTQGTLAKALGITQSAVSQFLKK